MYTVAPQAGRGWEPMRSLVHTFIQQRRISFIFEFRDEGLLFGEPYKNRVAVSFDVRSNENLWLPLSILAVMANQIE